MLLDLLQIATFYSGSENCFTFYSKSWRIQVQNVGALCFTAARPSNNGHFLTEKQPRQRSYMHNCTLHSTYFAQPINVRAHQSYTKEQKLSKMHRSELRKQTSEK